MKSIRYFRVNIKLPTSIPLLPFPLTMTIDCLSIAINDITIIPHPGEGIVPDKGQG